MDSFTPQPPSRKIEEKEKLVFNLFTLTEAEKEELKSRVLESKGIVRVMVHPYYIDQVRFHDPDPNPVYSSYLDREDIVKDGLKRILRANPDAPILIFEDEKFIPETTHRIKPVLSESKNKVYFIPTYPDNSLPKILGVKGSELWIKLIELLKNFEIKKIIIGGMILVVDKNNNLNGCVGEAVNNLKENFDVQISAITSPQSRKDVKNPDTKAKDENK